MLLFGTFIEALSFFDANVNSLFSLYLYIYIYVYIYI